MWKLALVVITTCALAVGVGFDFLLGGLLGTPYYRYRSAPSWHQAMSGFHHATPAEWQQVVSRISPHITLGTQRDLFWASIHRCDAVAVNILLDRGYPIDEFLRGEPDTDSRFGYMHCSFHPCGEKWSQGLIPVIIRGAARQGIPAQEIMDKLPVSCINEAKTVGEYFAALYTAKLKKQKGSWLISFVRSSWEEHNKVRYFQHPGIEKNDLERESDDVVALISGADSSTSIDLLRVFLRKGGNPNACSKGRSLAVSLAAKGNLSGLQFLLAHGADPRKSRCLSVAQYLTQQRPRNIGQERWAEMQRLAGISK